MKLRLVLALISIALVVSLSCTPTPVRTPTPTPTATPKGQPVLEGRPALVAARPLEANAQRGGILRIGYFSPITSADGFQAIGGFERMVFFISNEPLVAIGKDGAYAPAESLAYAFRVLDGGKRVRFFLRQGVQFQGGYGEMTAEDVAWGLNRIHDPDGGFGAPGLFRSLKGAEAVDRYTVDILMDPPDANMVSKLFERSSLVHSKKHWEEIGGADKHRSQPIGTGPYEVEEWVVGSEIRYSRHEGWWRGQPYADGVVVSIITEPRTRLARLQRGELNVAWLQAEMVSLAEKDSNVRVWSFGGVGFDGWMHTNGLPPFDDLRIRRAAVKAIDADAVNRTIYLGTLLPNHQWHTFAPPSPFAVDVSDLWQGDFLRYDPGAARKLVEEYAREKGFSLPLKIKSVCERRSDRLQFCEFIQAVWKEIGLDFDFDIVATSADRTRVMSQCQTHVTQGGSGILLPFQIERVLHSSGGNNYSGNPRLCKGKGQIADEQVQRQLDQLLDAAAVEFDPDRQAELYRRAQRLALENLWVYPPLLLRVNYMGCHVSTGGCDTNPHRADGFVRGGDFWIKR